MPVDRDQFLPLHMVWPCHQSPVQRSCLPSEGGRVACPLLCFSSDHPPWAFQFERALSDPVSQNSLICRGCDSLRRRRA